MDIAHHINTVYNGRQPLDFLEANCAHPLGDPERFCPAFILLDLNMPIMDGFEFLEAFQTQYAACSDEITICILTSCSRREISSKRVSITSQVF